MMGIIERQLWGFCRYGVVQTPLLIMPSINKLPNMEFPYFFFRFQPSFDKLPMLFCRGTTFLQNNKTIKRHTEPTPID
jgi:hypothetical protein